MRLTPFIMSLLKWLGASNKRKDILTDDIADEPSTSETSKTSESVPSTKKIRAYNPAWEKEFGWLEYEDGIGKMMSSQVKILFQGQVEH